MRFILYSVGSRVVAAGQCKGITELTLSELSLPTSFVSTSLAYLPCVDSQAEGGSYHLTLPAPCSFKRKKLLSPLALNTLVSIDTTNWSRPSQSKK